MSICGYPLQRRANKNFKISGTIWVCSNDPEVCGFVTNDIGGGKMAISKCPKCEDGYLVVKTIKNGLDNEKKILGCTNYKKDGTGCSVYMMDYNFSQDKEEVSIKFYDEKTDLNIVTWCQKPFKELVNSIIDVINLYKNLSMAVGIKLLFSILSGEMSKTVYSFKMYKNKKFGYLQESDRKKFNMLINAMRGEGIIDILENDYGRIVIPKDKLREEDYKLIYASIKLI